MHWGWFYCHSSKKPARSIKFPLSLTANFFRPVLLKLNEISYRQTRIQALFWISYFLFEWLNTGAFMNDFERSFCTILMNLPLVMIAAYWHHYVTIRRFLLKGRILAFLLSLSAGIIVFGVLRRAIFYFWIYPHYYPDALSAPLFYWPKILHESMQLHLVVSLFVVVDLVRHSLYQQQLSDTYKREMLEAEYRLLQSQVQPHFLFNTLNNLVSVSLHQSGRMPDLLQRLAGLLSYQLHESNQKSIPVSKEIEYLKDYIALEKIRYGERLDVQTNFSEWRHQADIRIPPMLLLPFVENAFKHGASRSEAGCWIQIRLILKDQRLSFTVENSVPEENNVTSGTGLGLTNLKKRLDILFPHQYELITLREDSHFLATLKFTVR